MRGDIDQHLIAREGWWVIIIIVLLTLSSLYLSPLLPILFIIVLAVACYFFRNPVIVVPAAPLAVVCPAHGKLLDIERSEDPWLLRDAILIRQEVGLWNVHSIRSPVEGKVMNEWSAECDVSGFNRRYAYWFQTDEGDDVVLSFLLGKRSPFTRMLIKSGERIGQGDYCGYLYFSGIIEIYLPANLLLEVQAGEEKCAGVDILGTIVHEEGVTGLGRK